MTVSTTSSGDMRIRKRQQSSPLHLYLIQSLASHPLQIHDLRHENINPMLGCLVDPERSALVMEHGTRGSLEDVLVQDDIKLDWSFRLSLLTDLVRVRLRWPWFSDCRSFDDTFE